MRKERIVIIGAGPAGCAAAVQCKRLGVSPLLVDRTGAAGGLAAGARLIENYPGLEPISGIAFAGLLAAHLGRFEIAVEKAEVESISPDGGGFRVRSNLGDIRASRIIAAIGTAPRTIDIPGAAGLEGVGLFPGVPELLAERDIGAGDRVFVIGGGEAALDYALTLADRGAEVAVMVRGSSLKGAGRLADEARGHRRIAFCFGACPHAVRRNPDGIEIDFACNDGTSTEVGCAAVVAIGRRSTAGKLLAGLDAEPRGAVSTGVRGLFVAGDARSGQLGQVGIAVGDGLAAAMAAVESLD